MTYWVIPTEEPEMAGAIWDKLYELFGTDSFSEEQGVREIQKLNPDFSGQDGRRILLTLNYQGALGRSEKES